jgi:hypothetical protein
MSEIRSIGTMKLVAHIQWELCCMSLQRCAAKKTAQWGFSVDSQYCAQNAQVNPVT